LSRQESASKNISGAAGSGRELPATRPRRNPEYNACLGELLTRVGKADAPANIEAKELGYAPSGNW
jgi:hypothetical protein